jgi:hypothetical protein
MTGTFPTPEFNLSYTITHRNLVRIGDQQFFRKNHEPTFYRICTPKKRLNSHSSLIKHNIAMNSTPLDSSFQYASWEQKKILPRFFRLREINKKTKNSYFWLPHQQMRSMTGTFPTPEFNLSYTITHRNLVRIGDQQFFRKNHEPLPSIEFAPRKNV